MRFRIVIACLGDRGCNRRAERVQFGAEERLLVLADGWSRSAPATASASTATGGSGFARAVQFDVDQIEIGVLQIAAIGIDLDLRAVEFLPDAFANRREKFRGGVGGIAIDGLLFDETSETLIVEQRIEDAALDRKSTRLNSSHPSISRMPSSA